MSSLVLGGGKQQATAQRLREAQQRVIDSSTEVRFDAERLADSAACPCNALPEACAREVSDYEGTETPGCLTARSGGFWLPPETAEHAVPPPPFDPASRERLSVTRVRRGGSWSPLQPFILTLPQRALTSTVEGEEGRALVRDLLLAPPGAVDEQTHAACCWLA